MIRDGSMQILLAYCVLTSALVYVLYSGGRWAIKGTGYWPSGLLGVVLIVVLLLGPTLFGFAFLTAMKQIAPFFWFAPPS